MGTVNVTIAGAVVVPARVIFLHPYLNFGLIQVCLLLLPPCWVRWCGGGYEGVVAIVP